MGIISLAITIAFGLFSVAAIALFIWAEWVRRPILSVERDEDNPPAGAQEHWIHLLISNRKPPWILARDLAVDSIARVSFLDQNTGGPLTPPIPQIEAHWSTQPEPRDAQNNFMQWLIPTAIRKNVGFRPEKIDVLVKYPNGDCYAADPQVYYRLHDPDPKVSHPAQARRAALQLPTASCRVRVEIEAANLGRPSTHELLFRNTGTALADFEWDHLPRASEGERLMTRGQRYLLWVLSLLSLLWVLKFTSAISAAVLALPPTTLIVLTVLVVAVAFFAAYKALGN
jgi:hypothetical protein